MDDYHIRDFNLMLNVQFWTIELIDSQGEIEVLKIKRANNKKREIVYNYGMIENNKYMCGSLVQQHGPHFCLPAFLVFTLNV